MSDTEIAGYSYGTGAAAKFPISIDGLELLAKRVFLTDEDASYLPMAGEVISDRIGDELNVWYGFLGSHSHLVYCFTGTDGKIDNSYLTAVRKRFRQLILHTCNRPYDQDWLNFHHEIGLQHHRTKKNQTDSVQSVPTISHRYLVAFIHPIMATNKPFVAKKRHSEEEVEEIHAAWFKLPVMPVALSSYLHGVTVHGYLGQDDQSK